MKTDKKIRFVFFPSREIGQDKNVFRNIINNIFPDEWGVYFIARKPMPLTGYAEHITPINMYDYPIYKKKVANKDIIEEEKWLGINFDSIIYMEDLYFHTKFRPSIKRKENIVRHIRFFRKFLKERKINLGMVGYPAEVTDIIFLYVVKKLRIAYWDYFMPFLLSDDIRYVCLKDYTPIKINRPEYDEKSIEKINNMIKRNINSRTIFLPEIRKITKRNFDFSMSTFKLKISQFKEIINNISPYESQFNIKDMVLIYLRNLLNSKLNNTVFSPFIFEKPKKNEKYFYFPLHFTRDASITFKEPFMNQLNLIKLISYSLPYRTKVYVKCHPHYLGSDFTFREFRQIKKLKNVRVLDYKVNNIKLIKNSLGVITINSTTGLEAIVLNKPLITFGNEFYAMNGISIPIKDFKRLRYTLIELIKDPLFKINIKKRKMFIYEYYMNSFPLQGHISVESKQRLTEKDFEIIKDKLRKIVAILLKKEE